jgi:AhpD family alkylhydroperoxidase
VRAALIGTKGRASSGAIIPFVSVEAMGCALLFLDPDLRGNDLTASESRLTFEDFIKIAPGAQAALLALGKVVEDSGFDKSLTELVKLRASQINGCAFCVQYHLGVARKLGVAEEKLGLIAAWKESGIFSDKECAALSWAESLTEISRDGASDDDYAAVRKQFSESEVVFLTVAIGTINSWNRIAVAFGFPPGVRQRPAK